MGQSILINVWPGSEHPHKVFSFDLTEEEHKQKKNIRHITMQLLQQLEGRDNTQKVRPLRCHHLCLLLYQTPNQTN